VGDSVGGSSPGRFPKAGRGLVGAFVVAEGPVARSLKRVGRLENTWTTNLADHPYFNENMENITLLHHARSLGDSREDAGIQYSFSSTPSLTPESVVRLTLNAGNFYQMISCKKWC
jgi:hypothetical protein